MFDIFYLTEKPNLFECEQHANSIEHAMSLSTTRYFWIVDYLCDYSDWDFLWEPPPWEKDFRHAFASQHQADCGTYLVSKTGYTETKYNSLLIPRLPNKKDWANADFDDFDYSWHPDPAEPPYLYHFPTQHQRAGGPVYTVPGATEVKYVTDIAVVKETVDDHWDDLSYDFDYTWHPDSTDEPYIYQFGTQHQKTGGPRYTVPGATEVKYISDIAVVKETIDDNWDDLSYDFDYTWHPDATDEPYIYQFGTQHQKTGGPRYVMPGATEVKYVNTPQVIKETVDDHWDDLSYDFDYTWHPDATVEPYIYQFGTQHQKTGGPRYVMPGATEVKYVRTLRSDRTAVDDNWEVPDNVDVSKFDFTWHPDSTDDPYIYQFGTQHQKTGGPRYVMPEATEVKYVRTIKCRRVAIDNNWEIPEGINEFDYTWHPDETNGPFIYQFGTQWQKTGGPRYVMPGATEVKYIHSPRCEKTSVDDNWQVPENVKFDDFDYTWHPDATDEPYIYQFGTQHQKTGGPRYVMPGATEVKYVDQIRIKAEKFASGAIVIDHFDGNSQAVRQQVEKSIDVLRVARYFDNYKDTLKRVLSTLDDQEFVWIVSSVCDYKDFDFTWHPEVWQTGMLHVFASNEQKFGDTFFVHVPTFLDKIDNVDLLEWYDCNFLEDVAVPRRPLIVEEYTEDSLVDAVRNRTLKPPVTLFSKQPNVTDVPTINLWRERVKTVTPLTEGGEVCLVPREAKIHLKTQLYDYPWIEKGYKKMLPSSSCDVIFISNGESMADKHWNILKNICPRAKRCDGIDGRDKAYKAAANMSSTDWFFAVFAKTEVLPDFKFDFQPDRLQEPKHYIFYSRNALNGLEYGSMNIDLYNKKLVLDTHIEEGSMLDFTLSKLHTVVPVVASIAQFNTDPWVTWRSAFREVIKLKQEVDNGAGLEIQYRLDVWCTEAEGDNAEYCLAGANDALEFYNSVNADPKELQKSFHWDWIKQWYYNKYHREIWLESV